VIFIRGKEFSYLIYLIIIWKSILAVVTMKSLLMTALLIACLILASPPAFGQDKGVREPILAGPWYPGSPEKLRTMVSDYLAKADPPPVRGEIMGIIVPHAGYDYSGQVAAFAYQLLRGSAFKRVVLIGPSHRVPFRGISVNQQSAYRTPLGTVPVDQAFSKRLLERNAEMTWVPQAHAVEHSLEIQIPFLQVVLKDFQIVPILMREWDDETCTRLAGKLSQALDDGTKNLILASTDLSHFHTDQKARALDNRFIEHVKAFDPKGLAQSLASGRCEACGEGPAVVAMLAARQRGASRSVVLKYANSGDVSGDRRQVVGYLSAVLVKEQDGPAKKGRQ
jgi:AmmeMemoRadiSam system protein B